MSKLVVQVRSNFLRSECKLPFIEKLQVLLKGEFGMLNAELWAAFHLVMQWVKGNSLPMGGILFLMTGDPKQLPPPEGTLLWLPQTLLANYGILFS